MLKILHCADLHLGSPFSGDGPQGAETRKNEQLSAFANMLRYGKDNGVDVIVVAGDLFDSPRPARDIIEKVIAGFAAVPKIKVIITPGNHDYNSDDSVWRGARFSENVTVFGKTTLERVDFNELGLSVFGYAFTERRLTYNPFAVPFSIDPNRINILAAHGDIRTSSEDCPITLDEIAATRCDYVALGHIHNAPDGVERVGDTYYGYSGGFDGRDFGEIGPKGALLVRIDKRDGAVVLDAKFVRFSHRRYEVENLNVTGAVDCETLSRAARDLVAAKGYGADTYLRLNLEGNLGAAVNIDQFTFKTVKERVAYLEVKDLTTPEINFDELGRDPTIRGAFYASLKTALASENKEEREVAETALRYGLAALEGNNIVDF